MTKNFYMQPAYEYPNANVNQFYRPYPTGFKKQFGLQKKISHTEVKLKSNFISIEMNAKK